MKNLLVFLVSLLFCCPTLAATNDEVRLKLKQLGLTDDQFVAVSQPGPGRARVYMTEDAGSFASSITVASETYTFTYVRTEPIVIASLLPFPAPVEIQRTGRYEVIPPGVSCGHPRVTAGTTNILFVGALVGSNAHVFSPHNWSAGDSLLQPGAYDGGQEATDTYATLQKSTMASDWDSITGLDWDYAIGKLNDQREYTPDILGLVTPKGVRIPRVQEHVRKSGRTTGVTESYVTDINTDVMVNYGGSWQFLVRNCTIYRPVFVQGGDSGSPVMGDDDFLVDVVFAGSSSMSVGIGDLPGLFTSLGVQPVLDSGNGDHEWVVDGTHDLDVFVKPPQGGGYFRLDKVALEPQEPEANTRLVIRATWTKLKTQSAYRTVFTNRDTGETYHTSTQRMPGNEQTVVFQLQTPAEGGNWPLRLTWYYDANE